MAEKSKGSVPPPTEQVPENSPESAITSAIFLKGFEMVWHTIWNRLQRSLRHGFPANHDLRFPKGPLATNHRRDDCCGALETANPKTPTATTKRGSGSDFPLLFFAVSVVVIFLFVSLKQPQGNVFLLNLSNQEELDNHLIQCYGKKNKPHQKYRRNDKTTPEIQ